VTRIGIVGAVIIIVVASIFFGFRKAAREHARAAATEPASVAPARIRQNEPETRQHLEHDQRGEIRRAIRVVVFELRTDN
jgi:hypothetical protein